MGSCLKCGAQFAAPTPVFTATFDDNDDMREATVQLRRIVTLSINGASPRDFYAGEVFIMNFALIEQILNQTPGSLIFLNNAEELLYRETYA